MAAVTASAASTANTAAAASYTIGTLTPNANDLLILVVGLTAQTSTDWAASDNQGGTWTKVRRQVKNSSGDVLEVWVRNQLASAVSTIVTFSHASGNATGCVGVVLQVSGMTRTGSSGAVKSQGGEDNKASGTPAPILSATPLVANPVITAVLNGASPPGLGAPYAGGGGGASLYTQRYNSGYSTPTTGLQVYSNNAGNNNGIAQDASVVWNSSSATANCTVAIELDTSVGSTNWSQPVNDSVTPTDATSNRPVVFRSESPALADAIVKSAAAKAAADSVAPTDAQAKGSAHPQADSLSPSDAVAKSAGLHPAESVSLLDAVVDAIALSFTDTAPVADSTSRTAAFSRLLEDIAAPSDLAAKSPGLTTAELLGLADQPGLGFGRPLVDSTALADGLSKAPGRGIADVVSLVDALARGLVLALVDETILTEAVRDAVSLHMTDPTSVADAVARTGEFERLLEDATGLSDARSLASRLSPAETLDLADALAQAVAHAEADPLAVVEALAKAAAHPLTDATSLSDVALVFNRSIREQVVVNDAVARAIGLRLSDAIAVVDFNDLLELPSVPDRGLTGELLGSTGRIEGGEARRPPRGRPGTVS